MPTETPLPAGVPADLPLTYEAFAEHYLADGLPVPCPDIRCGHSACRILRSLSIAHCSFCAGEIGYQRPFVRKSEAFLQHRSCVDRFQP